MKRLLISIASACLIFCCAPAGAQSTAETVAACGTPPATRPAGAVRALTQDPSGRLCGAAAISGGGDATAANQVLQIAQETAINTLLGLQADAACATDNGTCTLLAIAKRGNQRLTSLITALGTPFQAGGSIGNTTFASTVADGANVVEGAVADAVATQGGTGTLSAKLRLMTSQLNTLATNTTSIATAANQTAVQAPVAPATATATKSVLLGAQATTGAVNPTNGQQAALSVDTNNNLLVSSGGAPNLTTSQVTVTTSSTSVCPVRALRRSCSVTTITGSQQVFCSGTTATAGNGQIFPAVIGASFPFQTTAAVNCIAISSSQVVSVVEVY